MQKVINLTYILCCFICTYARASDAIIYEELTRRQALVCDRYHSDHSANNEVIVKIHDFHKEETAKNSLTSCCRPYAQSCIEHYDNRFLTTTFIAGLYASTFYAGGWGLVDPYINSEATKSCLCLIGYACIPLWGCVVPCNKTYIARRIIRHFNLKPADLNKYVSCEEKWR